MFNFLVRRYQSFVTAASLGVLVSDVNDPEGEFRDGRL